MTSCIILDKPVTINFAFLICHNEILELKHQASNHYGRLEITFSSLTLEIALLQ